jgi:hypothetical protein
MSCIRKIKYRYVARTGQPAQGRSFREQIRSMGGSATFPAARTVAEEESLEITANLERDVAAETVTGMFHICTYYREWQSLLIVMRTRFDCQLQAAINPSARNQGFKATSILWQSGSWIQTA